MRSKRLSSACCACSRTLPFTSTLLFLSLILPTTSYAQITNPASAIDPPSPTTLLTIPTSLPTQPIQPTSLNVNPTSTKPAASASPTASTEQVVSDHVFNYYFLIIAVIAVLFCICVLYIGNRKKRKAAFRRNAGQLALARDVETFRTRLGMAMGRTNGGAGGHTRNESDEGLDERGEAPPPYVPGRKPPSLRSTDGVRNGVEGEAVGLRSMTRGTTSEPPGYDDYTYRGTSRSESDSELGDLSLARPPPLALTPDRYGSTRRLLSSSHGISSNGTSQG